MLESAEKRRRAICATTTVKRCRMQLISRSISLEAEPSARNSLDLLTIIEQLKDWNITFRSFTENFETETPTGKLTLQMMSAIGEFERNTIVENVKWA